MLDLKAASHRGAAIRALIEFGEASGFSLVAFMEPSFRSKQILPNVECQENIGPTISLIQSDRLQSLPLTNPIEDWPIVSQSALSDAPFMWTPGDSKYFASHQFGNQFQIRVKNFFRRFRVQAAITTPVHFDSGKFGFVSWFCCASDPRPEERWQELLKPLHGAANTFLTVVPALPLRQGIDQEENLSQRELECLRWIALGRSTEETSELIGRSPETVRFHVRKAIRKLGATNRVHAVAIASHRHLLGELIDITRFADERDD